MNKEIPTNDWITIDRDPHAIKAAQLRAKLCIKYQRQLKSTSNNVVNDAMITADNSKIITSITDDCFKNDAKPSALIASLDSLNHCTNSAEPLPEQRQEEHSEHSKQCCSTASTAPTGESTVVSVIASASTLNAIHFLKETAAGITGADGLAMIGSKRKEATNVKRSNKKKCFHPQ
jgi:hypothetical protein